MGGPCFQVSGGFKYTGSMITAPLPFTAVIPMRAGSRGLPGKNIRPLAGTPLYGHSVNQALLAGAKRILITTNIDAVIAEPPKGTEVFRRPEDLAQDDTPMAHVLKHLLPEARVQGVVVLLQPTSPLRLSSDITAAIAHFGQGQFDLVMSVTQADASVLKWGTLSGGRFLPLSDPSYCFANRQTLPQVFRPNGAIYVFEAQWFLNQGGFETDRIGGFLMPAERSFDIDSDEDFIRCESQLRSLTKNVTGVL